MTGESITVLWRPGLVSKLIQKSRSKPLQWLFFWGSFQCWHFSMCLRYKHHFEPSPAWISHCSLKEPKLNQTTKGILSPDRETALRIKVCWVIPRKAQIHPSVQPPWLPVHNSVHQTALCTPARIPHGAMYFCPVVPALLGLTAALESWMPGVWSKEMWSRTPSHTKSCVRWPGGNPLQCSPIWSDWSSMCLQDTLPSATPQAASCERGSKGGAWEERNDCYCNTGSPSYSLLSVTCCHKENNIWLRGVIYKNLLSKVNAFLPYLPCLVC